MDNRYHNCKCPPLMNDGRFISSYVRGRIVDQYIRNINNINSAHEYKLFLQDNTDVILNNLNNSLKNNNICIVNNNCNTISLDNLPKTKYTNITNSPQPTSNYKPYDSEINYLNL
jgi:hypothetical protein